MTGDQQFFIDEMKKKVKADEVKFGADNLVPTLTTLGKYFEALKKDPDEAIKAYTRFVKAFFIHIDQITPGGDVKWPGKYCDSWSEVTQRPKHTDNTGRRIIDCEGYAFIVATLLQKADWRLDGFVGFYREGDLDSGHLAAELQFTGTTDASYTIAQDHVVSGSPETNRNKVAERDELFKNYPGGSCLVTWTDGFPTPKEAVDKAEEKMKASASKGPPPVCLPPKRAAGQSMPGGRKWA